MSEQLYAHAKMRGYSLAPMVFVDQPKRRWDNCWLEWRCHTARQWQGTWQAEEKKQCLDPQSPTLRNEDGSGHGHGCVTVDRQVEPDSVRGGQLSYQHVTHIQPLSRLVSRTMFILYLYRL